MAVLLNHNFTNASTYSSGPIDVSKQHELIFFGRVESATLATNGHFQIVANYIDANNIKQQFWQIASWYDPYAPIPTTPFNILGIPTVPFGDTISIDIVSDDVTNTFTGNINVIGK